MVGAAGSGSWSPWHSILTAKSLGAVFSMVLTSGFAKLLGSVSLELSSDLEKFQLPCRIHPCSPHSYSKSYSKFLYNTLVPFTPYSLYAIVALVGRRGSWSREDWSPPPRTRVGICRHPSLWLLLLDFPAAVMFSSWDRGTYSGGSSSVRAGLRKGWSYTLL